MAVLGLVEAGASESAESQGQRQCEQSQQRSQQEKVGNVDTPYDEYKAAGGQTAQDILRMKIFSLQRSLQSSTRGQVKACNARVLSIYQVNSSEG